jgi:hypothetical protein
MNETPIDRIPLLSDALTTALHEAFPLTIPNKRQTEREIWIEVGKQEMLLRLTQISESQHEDAEDTSVGALF